VCARLETQNPGAATACIVCSAHRTLALHGHRSNLLSQRAFGRRQSILTPPAGRLPVMSAECSSKGVQRRVPDPLRSGLDRCLR
jgi:hypothetical protein